ncbi:MAG TPA: hypothetical protein VJX67_01815 [Blastocatellia bacterium]|nr:hypothetical protein [Blastocatellia bacterium]
MPNKKGWASTVAGWFVEMDGPTNSESTDSQDAQFQQGDQTPGPDTPPSDYAASGSAGSAVDYTVSSPTQAVFQKAPPPAPGGQVDFEAVFESAGIEKEEVGRVGKAMDLLKGLPEGTDPAVKKQIVLASLKAFGVPIDKIIEAGVQEVQALDGYIRNGATDTEKLTQESDDRIKQYEQEIANIRKVMQDRVQEQQTVITVCNAKKLEVQQILEFFGQEEVARVVKASPKLHDPSTVPTG